MLTSSQQVQTDHLIHLNIDNGLKINKEVQT